MRFIISIIVFVLLNSHALKAGGWTQDKGDGYFKVGARLTYANAFYDEFGMRLAIPTYRDYVGNVYGEYGLWNKLTAVASIPFIRQVSQGANRNLGFSDPEIGFRLQLLKLGSGVISTEILLGLPLGESMDASGLLTGDGEFNQLIKLQLGYSFHPAPVYLTAEVGYNRRSMGFSDEIRYAGEIGWFVNEEVLLNMKIRGIRSLKNGDTSLVGNPLFANNQSRFVFAPEANFYVKKSSGISVAIEGSTLEENFLSGVTFSVGIFIQI